MSLLVCYSWRPCQPLHSAHHELPGCSASHFSCTRGDFVVTKTIAIGLSFIPPKPISLIQCLLHTPIVQVGGPKREAPHLLNSTRLYPSFSIYLLPTPALDTPGSQFHSSFSKAEVHPFPPKATLWSFTSSLGLADTRGVHKVARPLFIDDPDTMARTVKNA